MKNNYCKGSISLLFVLLILLAGVKAEAQDSVTLNSASPAAFDYMKTQRLWFYSRNAAGDMLDKWQKYADVELGYNLYKGDYHRLQQGRAGNEVKFHTEGGCRVKMGYVWGSFDYTRDKIKEAKFNASIIDPYRRMPYYIADTNASDWINQHFTLKIRAATVRLWNCLSLGLDMVYKNSVAAKQRDLRTKNLFYTIEVKPGIVLSLNDHHNTGLNFEYASLREEAGMENVNYNLPQTFYTLYGLGMAVEDFGNGQYLDYNANTIGGGFQYSYFGKVSLLFETGYRVKIEDVKSGLDAPKYVGTTKDKFWNGHFTAHACDSRKNTHLLKVSYQNCLTKGIEYVQKWNNTDRIPGWDIQDKNVRSEYRNQLFILNYIYILRLNEEYKWKFDFNLCYERNDDIYVLPASQFDTKDIWLDLSAKKNFVLPGNWNKRFLIGISVGRKENRKSKYDYGGYHPDYVIVSEWMNREREYFAADYTYFKLLAVYSQGVSEKSRANLFIRIGWDSRITKDFNYDQRMNLNFSIGCNF